MPPVTPEPSPSRVSSADPSLASGMMAAMPADRRTPARGARPQRRGPGRTPDTRSAAIRPSRSAARTTAAAATPPAPRPRLTGRAAVLITVLAVLTVSFASSLRAYLQQRDDLGGLTSSISQQQEEISALQQEKARWSDPDYVRTQAHARLGYVRPGETPFVVLRDGEPLETQGELIDPDSVAKVTPPAWYDDAWDSMKLAGNPQQKTHPPLTEIDGRASQ